MTKSQTDLIKNCRSRSSCSFLEDPEGVGATTHRPYILKVWNKTWCSFCNGHGTCLGPSCLGSEPPEVVRPAQLAVGITEIPGLKGPYKGTTLVTQKLTERTRLDKISSFKYPCFIPRRQTVPPSKPTKSTVKVINCSCHLREN